MYFLFFTAGLVVFMEFLYVFFGRDTKYTVSFDHEKII